MSTGQSAQNQSILSAVQTYASSEILTQQSPHLFSAGPDPIISQLKELVDSTIHISGSLNAYLTLPFSNPKLHSLLRQETAITHTVHNAALTVQQTVAALRKRNGILYGEDMPLEKTELVDWCTNRILEWGKSAGMEAFKDEESGGHITIVLGGKVIVIDMGIMVDRSDTQRPLISVANVKTSFAVPNGTATPPSSGSTSLDALLVDNIRAFVLEAQKKSEDQDPEHAARIGRRVTNHLKYLMKLDQLALKEGEGGLHWFNDSDILSSKAERYAASECAAVARDLSVATAPLDIFLMRAHALPLPYITTPSLSFLVHLSPHAYLTLLRTPSPSQLATFSPLPQIDIPFPHLRAYAGTHPRKPGVTIASLVLCSGGPRVSQQPDDIAIDSLSPRPNFPLASFSSEIGQQFPNFKAVDGQSSHDERYFLDFTDDGRYAGIVMSQTRMRDIEMVIHPLAGMDPMNNADPVISFGSKSWLDMLINPGASMPSERYVSLFTSPTSLHPPLQLKLAAPEEPGFRLEKVPVRNMKEVWAILEVVREQCWINETLLTCQWVPESINIALTPTDPSEATTTEDELNAVLGGTIVPRSIPVNITVHSSLPRDPIFDAATPTPGQGTPHRTAKIVMTSPEQPPISGLVEITVAYDSSRPRGIALSINGALGADVNVDTLEEVCRRGGVLGLPGRVWAKAHMLS